MDRLTVTEAAEMMGVAPQFLRVALQNEKFDFGVAVKRGRWTYYINPAKFLEYIGAREQTMGAYPNNHIRGR